MLNKKSFEFSKTILNLQTPSVKCHNHVTGEEAKENIIADRS